MVDQLTYLRPQATRNNSMLVGEGQQEDRGRSYLNVSRQLNGSTNLKKERPIVCRCFYIWAFYAHTKRRTAERQDGCKQKPYRFTEIRLL